MAARSPSAVLRAQLRRIIIDRIEALALARTEAAGLAGLSPSQLSRLLGREDIYSLERLVNAAERIGLKVRLSATRPYERR